GPLHAAPARKPFTFKGLQEKWRNIKIVVDNPHDIVHIIRVVNGDDQDARRGRSKTCQPPPSRSRLSMPTQARRSSRSAMTGPSLLAGRMARSACRWPSGGLVQTLWRGR